jgi:hypothetical protein
MAVIDVPCCPAAILRPLNADRARMISKPTVFFIALSND